MAFYSYLPHVSPRTPPSPLPPATTWGACFCLKWIFVLSRLAGLGGGKQGYLAATIYYTGDFDSSPSDKARVDPEPPVIMGSRDDRERDRVMLGRGDEDRVDQTRVGVRGICDSGVLRVTLDGVVGGVSAVFYFRLARVVPY